MPTSNSHSSVNPQNGFCSKTLIFHSLRPPSSLPPLTSNLSVTDYIFSLLQTTTTAGTASLIDAATRRIIPYSDVAFLVRNLAVSLRQPSFSLSHGDSAFVICPNSSSLPILYLSLFSLGVAVSPANPANSIQEISRQIQLCKPAVAFVTTEAVQKLLDAGFTNKIVVIESDDFESMMRVDSNADRNHETEIKISQSDTAAILYSSGTTGKIKGVKLTHRNLISTVAGAIAGREARSSPAVYLCTVPYFHIYGFILCIRIIAFGESLVSLRRFDLRLMVRSVEEFGVTHLPLAPPVVVALVDGKNEQLVSGADWRSLEAVFSGGAPLTVAVIDKFKRRFPNVSLVQAYGLTESSGGISRIAGPYESTIVGTVGRLIAHCQAKIVNPDTGDALPPMNSGELWVRGPFVMKGYVDDKEVKDAMVDVDGWLRTGDLCYFDNQGFLFVVGRLKELIKYKGYQVPPAELEHILHSHPDIMEAAVIPYPDEVAGQVPMGFVVRRRGSSINETQVKDFVAEQVAPYKKLRRVCFVDSIPKNASGKILRKDLIKMALAGVTSKL